MKARECSLNGTLDPMQMVSYALALADKATDAQRILGLPPNEQGKKSCS